MTPEEFLIQSGKLSNNLTKRAPFRRDSSVETFFKEFPCCAECLVQPMCISWSEFNNSLIRKQNIKMIFIDNPCVDFFHCDSEEKRKRYLEHKKRKEENKRTYEREN